MVEVIWTKRANRERIATLTYGAKEFGKNAAGKLNERIESYNVLLVENPRLGVLESLLVERRREYRSIVVMNTINLYITSKVKLSTLLTFGILVGNRQS